MIGTLCQHGVSSKSLAKLVKRWDQVSINSDVEAVFAILTEAGFSGSQTASVVIVSPSLMARSQDELQERLTKLQQKAGLNFSQLIKTVVRYLHLRSFPGMRAGCLALLDYLVGFEGPNEHVRKRE